MVTLDHNMNNNPEQDIQPLSVGILVSSGVSSIPGSPAITIRQSLLSYRIFHPSALLLGIQIILLICKVFLNRRTVSVLDTKCNNQVIQIPMDELQDLISSLVFKRSNPTGQLGGQQTNLQPSSSALTAGVAPEAPVAISLYIAADFVDNPVSPSVWIFIPIIAFPGLRGALPLLILGLLLTIFVRCVTPPETTGAKPLPEVSNRSNQSINLNSDELLGILRRYGKYFIKH